MAKALLGAGADCDAADLRGPTPGAAGPEGSETARMLAGSGGGTERADTASYGT